MATIFFRHSDAAAVCRSAITSQFFGNLYLDRFDHFATEVVRALRAILY
jgi:hypothetical protein